MAQTSYPTSHWQRTGVRMALAIFIGLACQATAHANIWGFIDGQGVAHFAPDKKDPRYELFFRTDSSQPDVWREKTSVTAPPKLLAFYEVSTNYKAVKHLLREAASAHQIDYELLQALISTESGFDTHAVSPRGAVGLMQLIPATAQRYGVLADANHSIEKKLTDPRINIRAGAKYLRDLLTMFPGQPELALAAYNAGEGAVQRAGNRIPNYPETQNYVKTVMQIYTSLKPPPALVERRRTLPALPPGGALRRGNMPTAVL